MGILSSRFSMRPRVVEDPTIRAELYTWSSAEFRDEYALIYTSRSNPSRTYISHYRVNRDKFLFTFHDCLCEGNPVRAEMNFVVERYDDGHYMISCPGGEPRARGRFIEQKVLPDMYLLRYEDKFRRRIGELELTGGNREDIKGRFTTGIGGDSLVTYFVYVIYNPLKGLEVDICGPYCEYDDYNRRPIGSCYLNHVSGMPPHAVVQEKKQVNDVEDHLVSSQSNAILNAGQTQGNFNGSNFRDCKFVVDTQYRT